MADCPISLEGIISTNPPQETWRIAPHPFNLDGKCTVKVTADGTPVTGSGGQVGNGKITGWTAINGTIVLNPPPTDRGTIIWEVTCPECTKQLRHDFGAPPKPPFESKDAWTILGFTIIFVGEGALVGGLFGGPVGLVIGAGVGIVIGLGGTSLIIWLLRRLGIL